MLLNINEIQHEVDKLTLKINYPAHSITLCTAPSGDGTPYISFDNEEYNYIYSERGYEFSRKISKSIDDLLYWIMHSFVSEVAFAYELKHRIHGRDGRRMAFPMIVELMANMNSEWGIRSQEDINEILSNAPYNDSLYL